MTELELPVVDFETPHLFTSRTGGAASIQVGADIERATVTLANEPVQRTWAGSVFAKLAFDGVYYVYP
jgi:hypothetical protein